MGPCGVALRPRDAAFFPKLGRVANLTPHVGGDLQPKVWVWAYARVHASCVRVRRMTPPVGTGSGRDYSHFTPVLPKEIVLTRAQPHPVRNTLRGYCDCTPGEEAVGAARVLGSLPTRRLDVKLEG